MSYRRASVVVRREMPSYLGESLQSVLGEPRWRPPACGESGGGNEGDLVLEARVEFCVVVVGGHVIDPRPGAAPSLFAGLVWCR